MESETAVAVHTERQALINQVRDFAARAASLVVSDERSYRGASEALVEIATFAKEVELRRKEETKPLLDQKQAIDAEYKPATEALGEARSLLEQSTNKWRREQERIRQEAQRRENERAEAERLRLAKLEVKAIERGDLRKADEFQQRAALVQEPIIPTEAPKAAGVSTRKVWKYRITDENLLPREYLTADTAAIGAYVKSLGEKAIGRIPGVLVYDDDATIVRSR